MYNNDIETLEKIRRKIRFLENEKFKISEKIAELKSRLEQIENPKNYICAK